MRTKILIVEDEADLRDLLLYNLENEDYEVKTSPNGIEAVGMAEEFRPDLVLLDLMLPDISGEEVCRRLRNTSSLHNTAIIMLTAKAAETDRVLGFRRGADDYVTKPFSTKELLERIKAILRRTKGESNIFRHRELQLDFDRHETRIHNRKVNLTSQEMALFAYLAQRRGKVVTRDRLLEEVWGSGAEVDSRAIDASVKRLRAKLEEYRDIIETVKGVGYKLNTEDRDAED